MQLTEANQNQDSSSAPLTLKSPNIRKLTRKIVSYLISRIEKTKIQTSNIILFCYSSPSYNSKPLFFFYFDARAITKLL